MIDERNGAARTGRLAAGMLLMVAAGCGGPTDSGGTITAEEASDLALAVAAQAGDVLAARTEDSGPAGDPEAAGSTLGGSILFSRARACDLGGKATMAGRLKRRFEPEGQELTVEFSMTVVHDACIVRSGERNVSLSGAPGLDVRAAYRQVEGRFDGLQRASVDGEVDWSAGEGVTGTCVISLETVLNPGDGTLAVRGEACGTSVERTVDA